MSTQPNRQAPFWSQPLDRLLTALNSTAQGLSTAEAVRRLQQVGPNTLKAGPQMTAFRLLLNQFKSPLVLILVFAVIVSAFAQEWIDAVIILVIILGSSLLGFWQEYRASTAVAKKRMTNKRPTKAVGSLRNRRNRSEKSIGV